MSGDTELATRHSSFTVDLYSRSDDRFTALDRRRKVVVSMYELEVGAQFVVESGS